MARKPMFGADGKPMFGATGKPLLCEPETPCCGSECVSDVDVDFRFEQDGFDVDFFDISIPPGGVTIVSRLWDFGDGNTSTSTNPSHTYATDYGTGIKSYTVTLTITDSNGCVATFSRSLVFIEPDAEFCPWIKENGDIVYESDPTAWSPIQSAMTAAVSASMTNSTCGSCPSMDGSFIGAWNPSDFWWGINASPSGCASSQKYAQSICSIPNRNIGVGYAGFSTHLRTFSNMTPIYFGMVYSIPPITTGSGRPCYGNGNATVVFFE